MKTSQSDVDRPADPIAKGRAVLGFELGSTRIKATLIGPDFKPLASGSYGWENKLENGVWTYHMEDVWTGTAACFESLTKDVRDKFGVNIERLASAGISGMMHGYLALDKDGNLLAPFKTWRNNITEQAAEELTDLFQFPIPQRWSIAHLYQTILNGEEHLNRLAHITTLAGYVHWRLTGRWVIGACEASGMFPVDPETQGYNARMLDQFDKHIASYEFPWKIRDLLPEIVPAGDSAGELTAAGARILDPSGTLQPGVSLCPPEGDAGTGMVATNSVRERTGNVSAGTSVFAMIVLERDLTKLHRQIDRVVTPDAKAVAMAHSNNCTSDFDAWISLFRQAAEALGTEVDEGQMYERLMPLALKGDSDAGGMLAYGYISGEHVTGFAEGRPLFVRQPDKPLTLENFLRTHLFASLGALRTGLNILTEEEDVQVEEIRGHGGFFKTADVGRRIMAAATNSTVSVLETAGEGGAWGMALLAAYAIRSDSTISLPDFLDEVFADSVGAKVKPDPRDVEGFNTFFRRYSEGLAIERAAVDTLQ